MIWIVATLQLHIFHGTAYAWGQKSVAKIRQTEEAWNNVIEIVILITVTYYT